LDGAFGKAEGAFFLRRKAVATANMTFMRCGSALCMEVFDGGYADKLL